MEKKWKWKFDLIELSSFQKATSFFVTIICIFHIYIIVLQSDDQVYLDNSSTALRACCSEFFQCFGIYIEQISTVILENLSTDRLSSVVI